MYSYALPAATASTVGRPQAQPKIEPLDREGFENLTLSEAESLLTSRFKSFIERGWDWKEALMLAVRPDGEARASVPH